MEFVNYLTVFVAPLVLMTFSVLTAYVHRFNLSGSYLAKDYIVFVVFGLVALYFSGAL